MVLDLNRGFSLCVDDIRRRGIMHVREEEEEEEVIGDMNLELTSLALRSDVYAILVCWIWVAEFRWGEKGDGGSTFFFFLGLAGRRHHVQIYPPCSGLIQANCRQLFSDIITWILTKHEFGHQACTFWSLVLPRYTIGSLCFSWTMVHSPSESATPNFEPPHPSPWPWSVPFTV